MPTGITVPAAQVRAILDAAVDRGAAVGELCRAVGIDSATLDEADARLPLEAAIDMYETAARVVGDDSFGLHVAERSDWYAFDPLGYALATKANVKRAVEELAPTIAMMYALASIGFARGDKVAFLAPNSVEAIEVLLGTMRAGGVIVPLSALLTPDVLLGLIDDSDASVLFVGEPYGDQVTRIRPRLRNVAAASIVGIGSSETDFVAVTLVSTPLYTNGTWMTLLPTLGMGGTTVLMRGFDASTFLDLVERERITHVFMVPTQLSLVLRDPEFDARDLSSLRITISSGSRLPPETKTEILTRMTRGLLELYGMSEGIGTVLEPEYMEAKLASVGRPIPGTEIRIIDELDRELPVGSIGEIVGSSPSVTRGYYKKPAETRALGWTAPDGQPFIRTGDIGRLDEDGFLYVLDRKKDMIISGGINVYASDLERELRDRYSSGS